MALELPIMPVHQTFAPNTVVPKDLSHLIDAFQSNYADSFMKARGMTDESIIGNSRANRQAAENRAGYEKANQDTIDQAGQAAPAPAASGFNWSAFSTPELEGLARTWGLIK
jgi:hypothetical protein